MYTLQLLNSVVELLRGRVVICAGRVVKHCVIRFLYGKVVIQCSLVVIQWSIVVIQWSNVVILWSYVVII